MSYQSFNSLTTHFTPVPEPPFSRANRHSFFTKHHAVLNRTEVRASDRYVEGDP